MIDHDKEKVYTVYTKIVCHCYRDNDNIIRIISAR